MSNPIRVIDLSHGEYIEVSSAILKDHLLSVLAELEGERDETLTAIGKYVRNVEELLVVTADYLACNTARGDSAIVHILLDRLTEIMQRHKRLFTYCNNYSQMSVPVMVRLSIPQALDFGY